MKVAAAWYAFCSRKLPSPPFHSPQLPSIHARIAVLQC
jgi:hypothetical protein